MAVETWDVAGTYNWVCPSWVTTAAVVCTGGGGGGLGGGGGGGGEAEDLTLALTAGASYQVIVGAAGTGSTDGGDSSLADSATLTTIVLGPGGKGSVSNTGGAGGSGGTGTTLRTGGAGGNSDGSAAGGGGSAAGTTAAGNDGGVGAAGVPGAGGTGPDADGGTGGAGSVDTQGLTGGPPGGGGGGDNLAEGGYGHDGRVQISYGDPSVTASGLNLPLVPDAGSGTPAPCAAHGRHVAAVLNSLGRQGILQQTGESDYTLLVGGLSGGVAPGIMAPYAGPGTPTGWLLCDGTLYPTATYPNLFAAIGYGYGGSGANFAVPNLTGHAI